MDPEVLFRKTYDDQYQISRFDQPECEAVCLFQTTEKIDPLCNKKMTGNRMSDNRITTIETEVLEKARTRFVQYLSAKKWKAFDSVIHNI